MDGISFETHRHWMERAWREAEAAAVAGEIPVGAVIVDARGEAIATGQNRRERDCDPSGHAEIVALREAARALRQWRLSDCTLYVTLEPCPMCAAAILQARVGQLVYGADDPKAGAVRTMLNLPDSPVSFHRLPVLGGVLGDRCRQQLQDWFAQRRTGDHPTG